MQRFAHLVRALAEGAGDAAAAGHVRAYLDAAAPADAAWAVHLLGRDRRRAAAAAAAVRAAAARAAGLDDALFAACLEQTGDLAEAVALVQPRAGSFVAEGLAQWMAGRVEPLRGLDAPAQVERLALDFAGLDAAACELHARLALGRLPPLDRRVLRHALAAHAGIDPGVAALRLERALGARTPPDARGWEALVARAPDPRHDTALPQPFVEPRPWAEDAHEQAGAGEWFATWRPDGQRAQLVRRGGAAAMWTAADEPVTADCPHIAQAALALPDGTVLDGWIVPAAPCASAGFVAFDVLDDAGGGAARDATWPARRARLVALVDAAASPLLHAAAELSSGSVQDLRALRAAARTRGALGLLLHRRDSSAVRWHVWDAAPRVVHAVLVYVEEGAGGDDGAPLLTFAVWNRAPVNAAAAQAAAQAAGRRTPPPAGSHQLVPIARTAPGSVPALADALAAALRDGARERFGPVRSVAPALVCEIAFGTIVPSGRRRAGVELRAPRVLRVRPDVPLHAIGTLESLTAATGEARCEDEPCTS
jgi:DNA ligase-1